MGCRQQSGPLAAQGCAPVVLCKSCCQHLVVSLQTCLPCARAHERSWGTMAGILSFASCYTSVGRVLLGKGAPRVTPLQHPQRLSLPSTLVMHDVGAMQAKRPFLTAKQNFKAIQRWNLPFPCVLLVSWWGILEPRRHAGVCVRTR